MTRHLIFGIIRLMKKEKLIYNVNAVLEKKDYVITSDAIILDK